MNWKKRFQNKKTLRVLCVVLAIAVFLGLCIPGMSLRTIQPADPLNNAVVQTIDQLQLGEEGDEQDQNQELQENPDASKPDDPQPEQTTSSQNKPDESTAPSENEGTGDGEEGQEDGLEGSDGGEEVTLDLGMVMTWYKYGNQPKTIVCGPSDAVSKTINVNQLSNSKLKYKFSPTGEEADHVKITSVYMREGNGVFEEVSEDGTIPLHLATQADSREYTFQVNTLWSTEDEHGKKIDQPITFTYVLQCAYALDLELELTWEKKNGAEGILTCAANKNAARIIESSDLAEKELVYTPKLTGALAQDATIVNAQYTAASGEMGALEPGGGSLPLQTANGSKENTYYFTFEVELKDKDGDVQTVYYHVTIVYSDLLDVDLSFTWLEQGVTRKTMICQPESAVSTDVKNNQLSAGAVKYEMTLIGDNSENARILNVSYISEAGTSGSLQANGALPMALPAGAVTNTYTIAVVVLAGGQQLNYEVVLHYTMDASLEMTYSVMENGVETERIVVCENGKTKTAEAIYDDQLVDGRLSYHMSVGGDDAIAITSVTCYQSGSGKVVSLDDTDELKLLLKNGKTGENTFTITAESSTGMVYEFKINIPYKHRGEKTIKIVTNMVDGQVVTNETPTNLNVSAWSEDGAGNVVSYIPANGTDTKLIISLDGEVIKYVSTSGHASEYILYPSNPDTGDTNLHTLHIYAEDAYGNFGEVTLTLKGQRNQAGQKKGTATIYVDMTVLGLGVVDSVTYEVLADEPISYSIAKAVLGEDTGDPFGAADNSMGWKGHYLGTKDIGFYLQSLTPGVNAQVLEESSWNKYGSTEQEILQAIDDHFGKGTGLATLWRCIYRNGLNKSGGSNGSYGEFDYTSGSGWLFSIDGTYYPGLAMSEYSLEDGDVLTLRYTLAYGWDVGSGTSGYGNTLGYCVAALNGKYYIEHEMETVTNPDGSLSYQCKYCGLIEGCVHEHVIGKNLEDGTHISYCEDCKSDIGDPEAHVWEHTEETHVCTFCQAEEAHTWKEVEGSNTATCTEPGVRNVTCVYCGMVKEEESPAKGHTLNNRWNHTLTEHYRKCSTCDEIITESQGAHQYVYHEGDDDWYCKHCDAGHDWDYCGNDQLTIHATTCNAITYYCSGCGLYFTQEGSFPENHVYENDVCVHCGQENKVDEEEKDESPGEENPAGN